MIEEIQFATEDVVKVLKDWRQKSEQDKKMARWLSAWVAHDFISPVCCFMGLDSLTDIHGERYSHPDYFKKRLLENIVQRAYVRNVLNLGFDYAQTCQKVIEAAACQREEDKKLEIEEVAEEYYKTLMNFSSYLPMLPIVESIAPLNEEQREPCNQADVSGKIVIYVANRFFSPYFKRDVFMLDVDASTFWTRTKDIFSKDNIHITFLGISPIKTKVDYMTNVIEPLVWNAREHAFNPENDVLGRMKEKGFWKGIGIRGRVDNEIDVSSPGSEGFTKPVAPGNYIVDVCDNGFGILETILPRIFEKDFSTKQDANFKHGIGLSYAKEFVEKYGGSMSVKTSPKTGTVFSFTIPYSRVEDYIVIQE